MCGSGGGASSQELLSVNKQLQQQLDDKTKSLSEVTNILNNNILTKGDAIQNVDRVMNDQQTKRTIKTLTIPRANQGGNPNSGINIPK